MQQRNLLFAKVFTTPEGANVLRVLQASTLDAPVYASNKQIDAPSDDALYAAWRDGQNQLVRMIIGAVNDGREGK